MAEVELDDVQQELAARPRSERRHRRRRRRRDAGAGRPVGLRQVHAAAHDRRAGDDHRGRDPDRRARGERVEPAERDIAMVFQNYALYPHMSVYENMAFGLQQPPHAAGRDRPARRARPRACSSSSALLERRPRAALGRPAPARRDGPRDRARARRRSCSTSRCPTSTPSCACRCGSRSRSCSGGSATTIDLRHPRPGRGDDAGRPDRGAERRRRSSRSARRWSSTSGRPAVRRRLHRLAADELRPRAGSRRAAARSRSGPPACRSRPRGRRMRAARSRSASDRSSSGRTRPGGRR